MSLILEFFQKYLFSARAGSVIKKISWLSAMSLGVSVASLIVVMGVMTALNRNTTKRLLSVEPHLQIEIPGIESSNLLEVHPLAAKLRTDGEHKVFVSDRQDMILRTLDGRFTGAIARGIDLENLNERLRAISEVNQPQGSGAANLDFILGEQEVMIGAELANSLKIYEGDTVLAFAPEALLLPVGEVPRYERLKIARVVSANLSDVDSQAVYYLRGKTLTTLNSSLSLKRFLEVWNTKGKDAAAEKEELLADYPGILVSTWQERESALFMALRLEKFIIGLFLGISGLIASFSLISLMVLLISQKQREIGLLQAIGLSMKRVKGLFFSLGFGLGVMGISGGALLGIIIVVYLQNFPLQILPDIYYDNTIPAQFDPFFILSVMFVGLSIAALGSFISAKQAILLSPSQSLRAKN